MLRHWHAFVLQPQATAYDRQVFNSQRPLDQIPKCVGLRVCFFFFFFFFFFLGGGRLDAMAATVCMFVVVLARSPELCVCECVHVCVAVVAGDSLDGVSCMTMARERSETGERLDESSSR